MAKLFTCDVDECESDDMDDSSVNVIAVHLAKAPSPVELHFCEDHADDALGDVLKKAFFSAQD